MNIIFKGEHRPDCTAMEQVENGSWGSPWYCTGRIRYGDKLGRDNGSTTGFVVFGCNAAANEPCPAEAWVEHGDLCDAIPAHGENGRRSS